ncbi:MAG: sigma-70 family RNA polymerase sigma factor [Prevotella sp.]|nr:sigma-70 family RNA polymerase sigma factor [Alistipes senegalensis]MCM1358149.1 sigma-70 family RNA polymerase sigma factor [Prevotella sp.]MCM1473626.1 sigma-70 family RNA polymerase sigma factor [Muribaculaceae bacterium]
MTPEDSDKIKAIYELYEQPMYRIAFAVLRNPELAEDAVSDAFVRIIDRLKKIKTPESERTKAYIVKIIKSTSINIYRKNKRTLTRETVIDDSVLQISDSSQNIEENVMARMENQNRRNLFNRLDETDRTIITLRYGNDLSWKEVAERTSMTESTARKRFERAKKKLISMKGEMSDEKI